MGRHKFANHQFPGFEGEKFRTNSTILFPGHYSPIIMFIGTHNDGDVPGNSADFFYGRNYFWPVWRSLLNTPGVLNGPKGRREDHMAEIPLYGVENSIYNICKLGLMTFADLVFEVDGDLNNHQDENIPQAGTIKWATDEIIDFLKSTPSIRFVYATRQMENAAPWTGQWDKIVEAMSDRDVLFGRIHTPSGMGAGQGPRRETLKQLWLQQISPVYLHEVGIK